MTTMAPVKKKVVKKVKKGAATPVKKKAPASSNGKASNAAESKAATTAQAAGKVQPKRRPKHPLPGPKTLLTEIRDICAEFAEDELTRKYEIGKRLNTGEASPKRYGEHFVPEVAIPLFARRRSTRRQNASRFGSDLFAIISPLGRMETETNSAPIYPRRQDAVR